MSIRFYPPESFIAREVAGYRITDFIDAGAVAQVFRGRRADDGASAASQKPEVAAIKLLASSPESSLELADFRRRFAREARILRRLAHPYILPLIEAGCDQQTGWFYLILPFMEGGSLSRALRQFGRPPLGQIATLLEQVADALDFAHAQGFVHRDVKPANILLDANGAPYLGDFGLARLGSISATERTTLGRVMGSPAYMAPEQFTDASQVGPAADVYSLGMVAYEVVTGNVAYHADSWPALFYKCLNEQPESPQRACPELPEPAAAAILNALEKDPERRLPSAGAFARAFALGLEGEWAPGLRRHSRPSARLTIARAWSGSARRVTSIQLSVTSPTANRIPAAAPNFIPGAERAPIWPRGAVGLSGDNWEHVLGSVTVGLLALVCLVVVLALALTGAQPRPATGRSQAHVSDSNVSHIVPPQPAQPTPTVSVPAPATAQAPARPRPSASPVHSAHAHQGNGAATASHAKSAQRGEYGTGGEHGTGVGHGRHGGGHKP